jgi:hypothetical protein
MGQYESYCNKDMGLYRLRNGFMIMFGARERFGEYLHHNSCCLDSIELLLKIPLFVEHCRPGSLTCTS